MSETIEVNLSSGVVVKLTIDGNLFDLSSEEFDILRVLAASIRSFEPTRTELQHRAMNGRRDTAPIRREPVKPRKPRLNGHPVDFDAVAKVYIDAVAASRPAIQALCEHFDVEHTVAKNWPGECRKLGLLPPRGEPVVHTDAPTQFVPHGREPLS